MNAVTEPAVDSALSEFVHDCFTEMGADLKDLSLGQGIWSAQVEDNQARYLGRFGQEQILFTFDLNRWDDGSKLECLTQVSPLVRRLQDYAISRGSILIAHVPGGPKAKYQSYLLARFAASIRSSTAREVSQWLGVNLITGAALNVKGDPMYTPDLVEGIPPGMSLNDISYGRVPQALQVLTDQWNETAKQECDRLAAQSQRQFTADAQQVYEASIGAEREKAILRLRRTHEISIDAELSLALVLTLPVR
jgi:hypothetical protein